jgi:predicted TIM-barrel enzyme
VSINAGDLIWTSSDDAVASVTAVEGSTDAVAVTGKSTGEVRITVTYKNLAAVTDTVSVRVDPGGNPALPVTRSRSWRRRATRS